MNFSESYFIQTLINDYVNITFTLKQQSYLNVAIHICHNRNFKNCIFSPELEITDTSSPYQVREKWELFLNMHAKEVCKTLCLPPGMDQELIYFIRWVAMHLIIWCGEWKREFEIPWDITSLFWMPSDWIGDRLNEEKIAERLMNDDRLTVDQRYKLACNYCLVEYIRPLWNELPSVLKNFYVEFNLPYFPTPSLVHIWSQKITDCQSYVNDEEFFKDIFLSAAEHGPFVAVRFSWNKLNEKPSYEDLYNQALWTTSKTITFQILPFMDDLSILLPPSITKGDFYCFILAQMSKENEEMFAAGEFVVQSFIEWPCKAFCRMGL
ncbi:uncharacterized protein LOC118185237 [Stegodyphus dumicola]|uniref:uncharacterized protein LOC118185237 n=1 Tax=Stegodyphus dumicola TaxID=202533 RepID=UPI0015AB9277|nr:uncharacterized protein LOC118185237 [Stegodyphus dumicola]XP_035210955.1 uncharacterized protein LOC118185237 [Stegodyphus dumicola]